jgi:hypothetical protein
MSLHHDTAPVEKTSIRLQADGFAFTMHQMFAPLVQQLTNGHHDRKIAQTREATRREIAHLPASLQQDLAFSDGTVIPVKQP